MYLRSLVVTSVLALTSCAVSNATVEIPQQPSTPSIVAYCDAQQASIANSADLLAKPYGIDQHMEENFADRKVSWLMTDAAYQKFIVETSATHFGRCNDSGCFLFAAPTMIIQAAVEQSMRDGKHDPAVLGKALGLPAKNFEGSLRMMTLDLTASSTCARLPIEEDLGVWKCQSSEDKDCFKFGGYTSGGLPELMVVNALVTETTVVEVP
jgi:hypothetical protein